MRVYCDCCEQATEEFDANCKGCRDKRSLVCKPARFELHPELKEITRHAEIGAGVIQIATHGLELLMPSSDPQSWSVQIHTTGKSVDFYTWLEYNKGSYGTR